MQFSETHPSVTKDKRCPESHGNPLIYASSTLAAVYKEILH
jgi:hypothetical protein